MKQKRLSVYNLFLMIYLFDRVTETEPVTHPESVHTKDVTTSVGQIVSLPCHSALNQSVAWSFKSAHPGNVIFIYQTRKFINGHAAHFDIDTRRVGDYNLVVRNPKTTNTGLYTCAEKDGVGNKQYIRLKVTEIPLYVAVVGQPISLPCPTTGAVSSAQWTFRSHLRSRNVIHVISENDHIADEYSKRFVIDKFNDGDHDLVIRQAIIEDSGEYTCLDARRTIIWLRLMVMYPERNVVVPVGSEVVIGHSMFSPYVSTWWRLPSNDILSPDDPKNSSSSFSVMTSHNRRTSVLHKDHVQLSHGGRYVVTVESKSTNEEIYELVVYEHSLKCNRSATEIWCHLSYRGNRHLIVECSFGTNTKYLRDGGDGWLKGAMANSCAMNQAPFKCSAVFVDSRATEPNDMYWMLPEHSQLSYGECISQVSEQTDKPLEPYFGAIIVIISIILIVVVTIFGFMIWMTCPFSGFNTPSSLRQRQTMQQPLLTPLHTSSVGEQPPKDPENAVCNK